MSQWWLNSLTPCFVSHGWWPLWSSWRGIVTNLDFINLLLDTPLKCLWSQDSKVNLHTINEGGLFSIISLLMFMLFPIMMDRFIDRTNQRGLLLYEHISALKSKMVTDGYLWVPHPIWCPLLQPMKFILPPQVWQAYLLGTIW